MTIFAEYLIAANEPVGTLRETNLEVRVAINATSDIVKARQKGILLASNMGFSNSQSTLIATVISELARNIILYANTGEIVVTKLTTDLKAGMKITALDKGPGIEDIHSILKSGHSTSGRLGLGLSGVRKIMDGFEIESKPGKGTKVVASIWLIAKPK